MGLAALLIAVWIASVHCVLVWHQQPYGRIGLVSGRLLIVQPYHPIEDGWDIRVTTFQLSLMPDWSGGRWVPVWIPVVPAVAIAASLWIIPSRRSRWRRRGECESCGYPLAGLESKLSCPRVRSAAKTGPGSCHVWDEPGPLWLIGVEGVGRAGLPRLLTSAKQQCPMCRESGQPYAAIFTFAPSLALVTLVMAKPPPPPIPKLTV